MMFAFHFLRHSLSVVNLTDYVCLPFRPYRTSNSGKDNYVGFNRSIEVATPNRVTWERKEEGRGATGRGVTRGRDPPAEEGRRQGRGSQGVGTQGRSARSYVLQGLSQGHVDWLQAWITFFLNQSAHFIYITHPSSQNVKYISDENDSN